VGFSPPTAQQPPRSITAAPNIAPRPVNQRKQFFFEKKNQKTFDYNRSALPHRAHQ
jgi:hypothetical protein